MKRILVLLSVVIGMGVLFLVPAPMALAQEELPVSGDERATAFPGNVLPGDCQVGGQPIPESNLTFSIIEETYLTITAVDAGYAVQSVYVKGGPALNLYQPGQRGLPTDPPYENLHAPLNTFGQPSRISIWFACGIVPEVDTTPPTVTTSTPTNKADSITATFSEEVQNVSTETFFLERQIAVKKSPAKYVLVDATVEKLNPDDPDDLSWVLNPVEDLPKGDYRATITTDVTDMADNALEDPVVWTFRVKK